MVSLIYSENAIAEIKEAAKWYEERSEGLGYELEKSIAAKIEVLKVSPERYAKTKGAFREVRIKKFPYKILYKYYKTKKILFITSIWHTSRNPKNKYKG